MLDRACLAPMNSRLPNAREEREKKHLEFARFELDLDAYKVSSRMSFKIHSCCSLTIQDVSSV